MAFAGADLDVGWTGRAHDLPILTPTELHVCLEDCDRTVNPVCNTQIVTGAGTANGTSFGPPIPVDAGGVPLCLVHEYDEALSIGGTANLSTGVFTATIGLREKIFLTDPHALCPRCADDGRCQGGAYDGGACVPDDRAGDVSRDCPPADDTLVATASCVPLTTGTSELTPLPGGDADHPCTAQPLEPAGVPPMPDACTSTCGAACTGLACVRQEPDSVTGAFLCIDERGGVGPSCCADDTTRSCLPTPIVRTGSAQPLDTPWPKLLYPKGSELEAVATFCHPATGNAEVDGMVGLPGPAAPVLPAKATWLTPAPCQPGSGGGPPAPY
jgi:hypothetical protein